MSVWVFSHETPNVVQLHRSYRSSLMTVFNVVQKNAKRDANVNDGFALPKYEFSD